MPSRNPVSGRIQAPDGALAIPSVAWPTVALVLASYGGYAVAVTAGGTGLVAPAVAVAGAALCGWFAFTLMHEASHGLLGRRRPVLNQVVGEIAATMLMCRFNGFRQLHLRHHRYVNEPRDPDEWSGRGPAWLHLYRLATSDLHYWFCYDASVRLPRHARRVSNVSLGLVVALLGGLLLAGFGWELLLYWVLPARIALVLSTYFFDYLPHQRPYGVPVSEEPCQASAVVRGGPVVDALLLGHTMHLVHHLFPTVPWYRLSALYGEVRDQIVARGGREVWPWELPRPYGGLDERADEAPAGVLGAEGMTRRA